jgi:hypothetical protein
MGVVNYSVRYKTATTATSETAATAKATTAAAAAAATTTTTTTSMRQSQQPLKMLLDITMQNIYMDIICQIGVNLLHTIYIDNFVYICTFIM